MHINVYSIHLLDLVIIGLLCYNPIMSTETQILRGHFHEHVPHEKEAARLLIGYFNEQPAQEQLASPAQSKPDIKEGPLAKAVGVASNR